MKQVWSNILSVVLLGLAFLVIRDQQRDLEDLGVQSPSKQPVVASIPSPEHDPRATWNRDNMLIRFNERRLAAGLKQVGESPIMDPWAQRRADEECQKPEPSHDGLREWHRQGLVPLGWSEIFAYGVETPLRAMEVWENSPAHRDAVLDPTVRAMGIGIRGNCVYILLSA